MYLNDEFLQHFMATFYGSGNYAGDYWFVGMEEGGGNYLEQVKIRLNAWKELGETELVDIFDFHTKIGFTRYFEKNAKLQPTWKQQARIVLASKGRPSETEDVRAYQRDVIGRKNSETCLLELLPLPSPNAKIWNYGLWSSLSFLKNRKTYLKNCARWRIEHIRSRIQEFKPKVVVFMGKSYFEYWGSIASMNMGLDNKVGFRAGSSEGTTYIITEHPNYHGVTNAYFEAIGSYIFLST